MIIHINGRAGVGKLTIGTIVAGLVGAKLLDNHSIYNVAFALTEFRSERFFDTVRAVRDVAFQRVLDLPAATPIILTNWYSVDSDWGNENWDAVISLARKRASQLLVVVLECSVEENARRIQSAERSAKRKPRDPATATTSAGRALLDRDGDRLLRLDVTELSADAAARRIADWVQQ